MQEIGIKLRADTKEAVKSVKDLEKSVKGLDNVKSRGNDEKGLLSDIDVKRFKRISQEAERTYKDFYERYNRIQRDFENKKKELDAAMRRNAGNDTLDSLKRQVSELQAKRDSLQSQARYMNNTNASAQQGMNEASGNGSAGTTMLAGMGKNLMGMMAGALAFGKLFGMAREGMGMVKNEEAFMMGLGQRTGGYAGDFQKAREDSYATGKPYGFTSSETMQTAQLLTELGGVRSKESMWKATSDLQWGARTMGVDVNGLAQAGGTLQKLGALEDGDMRRFANILTGAIKESGMAGRDQEFIDAVSGLSNQVASGQISLSQNELNNVIGLQSAIGNVEPGLKGQRGADMLGQMDAAVKGSGDNRMDLLLGWGKDYQGISGRADLERLKAKGISDPEVRKKIMSNIGSIAGGDKDYQSLMLRDIFGISQEQADRLLQDDMKNAFVNGSTDLESKGAAENDQRWKDVSGSEAMRRAQIDTKTEETKRYAGEGIDKVWRPLQNTFLSQPEFLQWGEMGAGALGASKLMSKIGGGGLLKGAGNLFKGAGGLFKGGGGSLLKGIGGKVAGPLAFLSAADAASNWGNDFGDWIFGHEAGQIKTKAGFSNPFSKPDKWEESKPGILKRGWDWFAGNNNKASAASVSDIEKQKVIDAQGNVARMEKANIDSRASLTDKEKSNLDAQKRNVDQLNNMVGKDNSSAGNGGGLFGGLFKGLFGIGGGGASTGSNFTAYHEQPSAALKNSALLGQSLKQQSSMSADEVNKWIASKAPSGSLMLGKGDTFLKAAQESGLDVKYLVAHAAQETGWGTSNIAKQKGNFFGIGAFDSSPAASAYKFNGVDGGIIEGAKWIAKNYADKGQDTLYSMRHNQGAHEYATDPQWDSKIASIMAGAPTQTLKVDVSGDIKNMEKKDSNAVANTLVSKLNLSPKINLSNEFRQGLGGNK